MSDPATTLANVSRARALARLLGYSLIGLLVFFVPFDIDGRSTILLDHSASALLAHARPLVVAIALGFLFYGALQPWLSGSWRGDLTRTVFSVLKVFGLLIGVGYLLGIGPEALYQPGMLPFLFDKLVLSLALIVPLGALALVFLIGFGLLELVGVLMQPVMRPIWRTPGKSAIDAVASFVGSYSVGLLITDRMYRQGHYSVREAAIIATGFSTVSAPFMVIIAKTLGLMDIWNLYFWSAMLVTFSVTAVSARIYPLSRLPSESRVEPPLPAGESRIAGAWRAGLEQAAHAPSLPSALRETFIDGLRMTAAILPSILAVGLLGLLDVAEGCRRAGQIRHRDRIGEQRPVPVRLDPLRARDTNPPAFARPVAGLAATHPVEPGIQHSAGPPGALPGLAVTPAVSEFVERSLK
jgi:nucleoside recognition membrane protein YjiH